MTAEPPSHLIRHPWSCIKKGHTLFRRPCRCITLKSDQAPHYWLIPLGQEDTWQHHADAVFRTRRNDSEIGNGCATRSDTGVPQEAGVGTFRSSTRLLRNHLLLVRIPKIPHLAHARMAGLGDHRYARTTCRFAGPLTVYAQKKRLAAKTPRPSRALNCSSDHPPREPSMNRSPKGLDVVFEKNAIAPRVVRALVARRNTEEPSSDLSQQEKQQIPVAASWP